MDPFGNEASNIFVLSAKSALGFCFFVDTCAFLCNILCVGLTWQLQKQVSGYCIWCLNYCRLIALLKQMISSTLHSARLEITSVGLWLWGIHPIRHPCLYFRTTWVHQSYQYGCDKFVWCPSIIKHNYNCITLKTPIFDASNVNISPYLPGESFLKDLHPKNPRCYDGIPDPTNRNHPGWLSELTLVSGGVNPKWNMSYIFPYIYIVCTIHYSLFP